jgi:hypothetical protein
MTRASLIVNQRRLAPALGKNVRTAKEKANVGG